MTHQNTQTRPQAQASSPSQTQVQALARYAARASFDDLSPASRELLPLHILDSLGCCIAALGAGPVQACHEQVADFGGSGPCVLIGGGKANPVISPAPFFDSLPHFSDNIPGGVCFFSVFFVLFASALADWATWSGSLSTVSRNTFGRSILLVVFSLDAVSLILSFFIRSGAPTGA